MKSNLYLLVSLILAFASCRKGEELPELKTFQPGLYSYDLYKDDLKFENYHVLKSYRMKREYQDQETASFKQYQNYAIPFFDSTQNHSLIAILKERTEYELYHAGLYRLTSTGSWFNAHHRTIIVPNIDFEIDALHYRLCYLEDTFSHYFERDLRITVSGKSYEVYKMIFEPGFNCIDSEQHYAYVDRAIGIVRYEVWDIPSNTMKYRLDFNNFQKQ